MDELDKGLAISVRGPLREEAIREFRARMTAWDVPLPPAETLVLDFGLGDFRKVGLVECWIANEIEAGYCAKYLFVFDGQSCPSHRHREKMETFFILKGRVRMVHEGEVRTMQPGDVLPVRPWTRHSFTGLGPALLLEVSKPCMIQDNHFDNPDIPIGGNYKGEGRPQ